MLGSVSSGPGGPPNGPPRMPGPPSGMGMGGGPPPQGGPPPVAAPNPLAVLGIGPNEEFWVETKSADGKVFYKLYGKEAKFSIIQHGCIYQNCCSLI